MFWLQSSLSSILTTITTDNHLLTEDISTEEWISNRKKSQRFEHFDAHIVSLAMWRMRREPVEFPQDLDVWKTSENNTPDPGLVTCSGRWDPTPALTHVVWTRTARGTCLPVYILWMNNIYSPKNETTDHQSFFQGGILCSWEYYKGCLFDLVLVFNDDLIMYHLLNLFHFN